MSNQLNRLIRIMGTFDLATGHADTMDEALDALETELRDLLGHYREALKQNPGMTLRDYFAAKAMLGLMRMERAEQFVDEDGFEMGYEEGETGTLFVHTNFLAEEAYMIADMMLKAREE